VILLFEGLTDTLPYRTKHLFQSMNFDDTTSQTSDNNTSNNGHMKFELGGF
jgi:hypothetical protein